MDLKKILIFVLFAFIAINISNAIGIGISPAAIELENVLIGTEFQVNFSVSNPNNVPINCIFEKEGEIAQWIAVEEEFTIDAKKNKILTLTIMIPKDAQNRTYSGTFMVAADPISTVEGTGSAISAAVGVTISIDVTSEKYARISIVKQEVYPILQNFPIEVEITLSNTGNDYAQITYDFEIWDGGKTRLYYENSQNGSYIAPNEQITEHLTLEIPPLLPGEYILVTNIYSNGEFIGKIETKFTIYPTGTVLAQGNLLRLIHPNQTKIDETVSIQGLFYNVGDLTLFAKFKVGIFDLNGNLIDIIEGDLIKVDPNQTLILENYYKFKEAGHYQIKGKVLYSGTSSNELESFIDVSTTGITIPDVNIVFLSMLIILLVIVVIIIWVVSRKRKRKQEND